MSTDPPEGPGTLPLELVDQIDQVCDRYEAARAAGEGPRIEDYLGGVTESGRSALLRELLASELEWRRGRGERPTPEDYAGRFPSQTALIAAAFDEASVAGCSTLRPRRSESRAGDCQTLEAVSSGALQPGLEPLPGYRLRRRLGGGGFGEVWEAEAPGGVPVALKFVPLLDAKGPIEQRALETIKKIRHPNLLALFGAWQAGGVLVIGMELADCTLMDRLNRARDQGLSGIPGDELIEYFAEAAKGIDYLNEHIHALDDGPRRVGVQHRDIKPQNILLVGGGVKVADFGLARLLDQSRTGHTGSLTPSYAAPEFFKNQTSDHSDQYSLAVSYCVLRGGRLPFNGSMAAVMAGHLYQPPDLTMLPKAERPVLARALAKNPADRWPTCRAFVTALRACLPDERTRVRGGRRSALRLGALLAAPVALGLALWGVGLLPIGPPTPPQPRPEPQKKSQTIGQMKPSRPSTKPHDVRQASTTSTQPRRSEANPPRRDDAPTATSRPDPREAAAHVARGNEQYEGGEYELAIESYSEALWHDPDLPDAYNNRGNAYTKLGHNERAIEDYDRAIQLAPKDPFSYYNRGNARFTLGQYEPAISDYTQAIALNPDAGLAADAYVNRSLAHETMGNADQAQRDQEAAERLESRPRSTTRSPD